MKPKINNIIYFFMVFFACGSYMLSHSTIPVSFSNTIIVIHIFDYSSYLLGFYLIAKSKITSKKAIYYAAIALALMISALFAGDIILIKGFIIVLASTQLENTEVIKNYLTVITIFTLAIVGLCLTNMIEDVTEFRYVTGTLRRSFGFSHPNRFGYIIILYSLAIMYLHYKRYKIYDLAINLILIIFVLKILNNRTAAIMLVLITIFELYFKLFKKVDNAWMKKVAKIAIFIAPVFSLWITIAYNQANPIHIALNELITGRLYLSASCNCNSKSLI